MFVLLARALGCRAATLHGSSRGLPAVATLGAAPSRHSFVSCGHVKCTECGCPLGSRPSVCSGSAEARTAPKWSEAGCSVAACPGAGRARRRPTTPTMP
ncbi:unnamed protein product, partial [Brenthis ino]